MSNSESFWTSDNARQYPNMLRLGDREYWEPGEQQRRLIGEKIRELGWCSGGEILDLGAGPCSKWIFGEEMTTSKVWAVDFSPQLLAQGGVSPERRLVADLRTIVFPENWKDKFDLITAILLFRYLDLAQREKILKQTLKLLSENGRLVLVDFDAMRPDEVSKELGEVEKFNVDTTKETLIKLGYKKVEKGEWSLVFEDGGGDLCPFSVHWITAVSPES